MQKTLIVADIGINHGGSINKTRQLVDACLNIGVDIVKFQTVSADEVYPKGSKYYNIFKQAEFPETHWRSLKTYIESNGGEFMSTPGSKRDADMLDGMGVKRFKVASDSANNMDFVNYVLGKNKPTIVSTGMMTMSQIQTMLKHGYRCKPDYILHCVSHYPTLPINANLGRIGEMLFHTKNDLLWEGINIGYSDHVAGMDAAIASVALGATLVEKHIKLDNNCVDAAVSLNPTAFKQMIDRIRKLEQML